jgi:VanZ family protein
MKYISALFFIFVIAVIILADYGSLPHSLRALYDFPNGDKVGHFILFGLLDFFLTRAFLSSFPSKPPGWVTLSIGLILALFLALEEWSQRFFSTRTFDPVDLLASYLGLIVGGYTVWRIKK